MTFRPAAWVVLTLPALAAAGVAAYIDAWIYPAAFALWYLATAAYSIRWGPEGWVLVFAGGEPLVLATAGVSSTGAVLVQIAVFWAAMLTAWEGESRPLKTAGAVSAAAVVGIAGVAGIFSVHSLPLLLGTVLAGAAAVAAVGLSELRLKKKVGILR